MKRIAYYTLTMVAIIIILPFIIVRGCDFRSLAAPTQLPGNVDTSGKSGSSVSNQSTGSTGQNNTEINTALKDTPKVTLKVYVSSLGAIKEMELEEYVKGVVSAEMPAEFEQEALNAQAVAARTFAYSRYNRMFLSGEEKHPDADVCTDFRHCQAWMSKEEVFKAWNSKDSDVYWAKIEKSVADTEGMIIVYDNEVIIPVFHSNSGGMTENIENVWAGEPLAYLKSVESKGEEGSTSFKKTVVIKNSDFTAKMKAAFTNIKFTNTTDIIKDIKIVDRTESGRVNNIKVGNTTMKGTDFREILSLNSTNFSVEKSGTDSLKITTIGNGHGVGMSQWGANAMAKSGADYEEILKYYYQGVEISKIGN